MTELLNYINDTRNSSYNFSLGRWYEDRGHTAAAAGYYIRTTEFAKDDLLIYEALLRISICFLQQGSRVHVSKGVLLRAVALMPERPEAYFLLSQLYEHNKDWPEAYTWATLGEKQFTKSTDWPPLKTNVGYPGSYVFVFEKAISAWWLGLIDESLHLFRVLDKRNNILTVHAESVRRNLVNLGNNFKAPLTYYDYMYERLKVKFPGARDIKRNYSQCYQDMFVLTILNGKKDGKFVEIGCGDPFYGNNTALLEQLGWTGISIDIDENTTKVFADKRKSQVITADATKIHYDSLLSGDYDYLQIDCDPALNSLEVLLRMPFESCRFAVITFEHDAYCSEGVKERSRAYLNSLGYKMIVGDIAPDKYMNFEDWWIHPDLTDGIPAELITYSGKDKTRKADEYILNLG
jgi:hypothetical protein